MKITVKYLVEGDDRPTTWQERMKLESHLTSGPLRTGLDAANRQLADEGKKLRLRLVDMEVE